MVTKDVTDKEISNLFIRIGRIQYIILAFVLVDLLFWARVYSFMGW